MLLILSAVLTNESVACAASQIAINFLLVFQTVGFLYKVAFSIMNIALVKKFGAECPWTRLTIS